MHVVIDEHQAEEVIRSINEPFKSKRKALTYDIFCGTFAQQGGLQSKSVKQTV